MVNNYRQWGLGDGGVGVREECGQGGGVALGTWCLLPVLPGTSQSQGEL